MYACRVRPRYVALTFARRRGGLNFVSVLCWLSLRETRRRCTWPPSWEIPTSSVYYSQLALNCLSETRSLLVHDPCYHYRSRTMLNDRVSVRPSVRLSRPVERQRQRRAAGLLLSAGACSKDRSTAVTRGACAQQ